MPDHCQDCGQRIWRLSGDWLLQCHRCGWTEGYPVLRYVTHLPVRFVSIVGLWKILITLLVGILALSVLGTSLPDQVSGSPNSSGSVGLNESEVEILVHEEVNERRESNDIGDLEYVSSLSSIAKNHSQDMAEKDYFSHTQPDGDTVEDRYRKGGYSCPNPGENIASSYYKQKIDTNNGVVTHNSAEELATGIVNQWMNSTEHKQNVLSQDFSYQGIGVYATSESRVYVTQNFC